MHISTVSNLLYEVFLFVIRVKIGSLNLYIFTTIILKHVLLYTKPQTAFAIVDA
jgi:hypothetical protein